ncbi:hypothetical protein FOL47_009692 [Perkinsus chesapeaki]|uniref:Uncharacterized protein n=1 Tax=Perkinsus chesapeaki TaxID=330153 RepID=A0A7J6L6X1_PERCH|nr:hypothetical protein FOL47_009692 [Perkinsus chesapeaki]
MNRCKFIQLDCLTPTKCGGISEAEEEAALRYLGDSVIRGPWKPLASVNDDFCERQCKITVGVRRAGTGPAVKKMNAADLLKEMKAGKNGDKGGDGDSWAMTDDDEDTDETQSDAPSAKPAVKSQAKGPMAASNTSSSPSRASTKASSGGAGWSSFGSSWNSTGGGDSGTAKASIVPSGKSRSSVTFSSATISSKNKEAEKKKSMKSSDGWMDSSSSSSEGEDDGSGFRLGSKSSGGGGSWNWSAASSSKKSNGGDSWKSAGGAASKSEKSSWGQSWNSGGKDSGSGWGDSWEKSKSGLKSSSNESGSGWGDSWDKSKSTLAAHKSKNSSSGKPGGGSWGASSSKVEAPSVAKASSGRGSRLSDSWRDSSATPSFGGATQEENDDTDDWNASGGPVEEKVVAKKSVAVVKRAPAATEATRGRSASPARVLTTQVVRGARVNSPARKSVGVGSDDEEGECMPGRLERLREFVANDPRALRLLHTRRQDTCKPSRGFGRPPPVPYWTGGRRARGASGKKWDWLSAGWSTQGEIKRKCHHDCNWVNPEHHHWPHEGGMREQTNLVQVVEAGNRDVCEECRPERFVPRPITALVVVDPKNGSLTALGKVDWEGGEETRVFRPGDVYNIASPLQHGPLSRGRTMEVGCGGTPRLDDSLERHIRAEEQTVGYGEDREAVAAGQDGGMIFERTEDDVIIDSDANGVLEEYHHESERFEPAEAPLEEYIPLPEPVPRAVYRPSSRPSMRATTPEPVVERRPPIVARRPPRRKWSFLSIGESSVGYVKHHVHRDVVKKPARARSHSDTTSVMRRNPPPGEGYYEKHEVEETMVATASGGTQFRRQDYDIVMEAPKAEYEGCRGPVTDAAGRYGHTENLLVERYHTERPAATHAMALAYPPPQLRGQALAVLAAGEIERGVQHKEHKEIRVDEYRQASSSGSSPPTTYHYHELEEKEEKVTEPAHHTAAVLTSAYQIAALKSALGRRTPARGRDSIPPQPLREPISFEAHRQIHVENPFSHSPAASGTTMDGRTVQEPPLRAGLDPEEAFMNRVGEMRNRDVEELPAMTIAQPANQRAYRKSPSICPNIP